MDLVVSRLSVMAFRAGRSSLVLDREGLLGIVLLMLLMVSQNWNVFIFIIFLAAVGGTAKGRGSVM